MKRVAMMLALMLAFVGCETIGGSNSMLFDSTNTTVTETETYGPNENGEQVLLSRETVTEEQAEQVAGDTNAGIGRSIEGAVKGAVTYDGDSGSYTINMDESAAIQGSVASDLGGAFIAGVNAERDVRVAETAAPQIRAENESLKESNRVLHDVITNLEARIDELEADAAQ